MELLTLLEVINRRKWFLIITTLIVTLLAALFMQVTQKPTYRSTVKMIMSNSGSDAEMTMERMNLNISLMNTFKELIKTPTILGAVIRDNPSWGLSISELADRISVSTVEQTPVMSITVRDVSESRVIDIMNDVTSTLKRQVAFIYKMDNILILDDPNHQQRMVPEVESHVLRNTVIVGAACFILLMLFVSMKDMTGDVVRNEARLRELELSPLVSIEPCKRGDMLTQKTANTKLAGDKKNVPIST
ncbi:YveK family protein [Paenibacillus alvei]|uniref:YveK family protein n=1 Tax=Paenibacillus alvei TaxID=44250 RepID=UPI0022806949|nr:Wzz/FepE/Etk N-terminal domain-containing protein [Paenibacillus alvei]